MNKILKYIVPAAALLLSLGTTSCLNDLHVNPIDPSTKTTVYASQLFNKCYANFGLAGNGGANGDCDVDGIDGGTSGLYRQYWNSQELTTDEALCGWGDEGIGSFCHNTYDASHPMLKGYYYRLTVGIAYCNQYLSVFADTSAVMSAEVRFLRAMQYYLLMDAFGQHIPFTTTISSDKAPAAKDGEIFNFIESELLAICGDKADGTNQVLSDAKPKLSTETGYGRVDKAAAWLLLARLYLNAKSYTGTEHWSEAKTYAEKVINSGYQLYEGATEDHKTKAVKVKVTDPKTGTTTEQDYQFSAYQALFMGDNDKTDAAKEAIFPIISDGLRTTSWGVSLFLIASTHDANMHDNPFDAGFSDASSRSINGVSGQAWGGNRARPQLVKLFFQSVSDVEAETKEMESYDMPIIAGDDRAIFNSVGRTLNITDESTFTSGYGVAKFNNLTTDGSATKDATHPDMDVFFMRKAEAYLIAAEAIVRMGGDNKTASGYVNALRDRANASEYSSVTLQTILDEWGREFYFEGLRRTTLIRFDKFGGSTGYQWQWKGNAYDGTDFASYRNVFAIPTSDLNANNNLTQNDGYK